MKNKKIFKFKTLIFSSLLLLGGISAAISMNRFDHRANAVHADSITDLTGYTWEGNGSLSVPSDYNMYSYSISFVSNSTEYSLIKMGLENGVPKFFYGTILAYGGTYGTWDVSWKNDAYKTIEITGGTDATNSTLISWLQSNGTLSKASVPVTGVTLDQDSASVNVGSTVTLTATVSPSDATDKTVSWSTSDSSVATVAGGVVTGVAAGSATITVTTTDGSYTDTCTITVNTAPVVAVTGVTLDKDSCEVATGDNVQLTETVAPNNATNKTVNWSTSDSSVATVSDGLVTGVSEGVVTITVTTVDGGFTDTCTVTVTGVSTEGLYTTIIVKDTINWAFRTLWLDNFTYADGYDQTQRNLFISSHYGTEIANWDKNGGTRGYHYYNNGVNLSAGGYGDSERRHYFQLPAWITSCTIQVEDNQHYRPFNTIDNLASGCSHDGNTSHAPVMDDTRIGSGVGKTITLDIVTGRGNASISDNQVYSDEITINKYYLSSSATVKATEQDTCHKYYLPDIDKVAIDGYATNNKWYSGTTYADASSEFDTSNIITSSDAINVVSKYEVGSNDPNLEIRFTRPSDWGNNTVCIHTWNDGGSTTTWPGYAMTYLKDNEYSQSVWTWSPSFDEPLYGLFKFNNNNNGYQSDQLEKPTVSTAYWYNNGWQSGSVPTINIFLYDYDNIYAGRVHVYAWRNGTNFKNSTSTVGLEATQLSNIATNGLIYKFTMSDRYDRVKFSNNGANQTSELTPTANYCYVKANSIEGKDTWWTNINYVFAHNFSQHTMLMDGTVSEEDHSSTPYCAERYAAAKEHFEAIMNSGYGTYVLTELNNNFSGAMTRFAAWAAANGESVNGNDGTITTSNTIMLSMNVDNFIPIIAAIAASGLAIGGYFLFRRKRS